MLQHRLVVVPAHVAGTTGWHWADLLTAVLIVVAIVGVALAVSGRWHRRQRIEAGEPPETETG